MTSLQLERCRIVIWILANQGFIVNSEVCECQLCSSLHLNLQLGSILHLQLPLVYFIYGARILKLFSPVVFKELLPLPTLIQASQSLSCFLLKVGQQPLVIMGCAFGYVFIFPCVQLKVTVHVNLSICISFNLISPSVCSGSGIVMSTLSCPAEWDKVFGMCENYALDISGKFQ